MRILNNDEVKLCTEQFEKLLTSDIDISDLFCTLDSILYEYADYIIGNGNSCPTKNQAENLYYLKKLRDVLIYDNKEKL